MESGEAELVYKITPDDFREHMKRKNKAMVDKRMTIGEAVERYIRDGDLVAMGGVSFVRLSMAVVYEIIRRGIRIYCAAGTRNLDVDMLIDNDCILGLEIGYILGLEVLGIPRYTRQKVENGLRSGRLKVTEWCNGAMAWRHKAAAMGLPFLPVRDLLGTDTFKKSAAKKVKCPFTGIDVALLPALYVDTAVVHVHRADIYGNCQIEGAANEDPYKAMGAKNVIITTEKIVDTEEIRRNPERTHLPYYYVDAVVEVPYGAHPSNMPGMYYADVDFMHEYLAAASDPSGDAIRKFYAKYVFGVGSFEEYLEVIGGRERLGKLEDAEFLRDSRESVAEG